MLPQRVLIVDDEPHILLILDKVLQKYGCHTVKAESGEMAIKAMKNNEFDIMILDVMMPSMSGIELCRHIRENPATKDKPVVILTADHDEKDRETCFNLGVEDYITKPFSPKKLVARIKEILDKYSTE